MEEYKITIQAICGIGTTAEFNYSCNSFLEAFQYAQSKVRNDNIKGIFIQKVNFL